MDISDVLKYGYPGTEWTVGETYESLDWRGPGEKPTIEELEAKNIEYANYKQSIAYQELRRVAYPSIDDQLDILYHQGYEGWKNVILAVKQQYPKPE